jgi:23S rRNA (cytidine1920-2'-O)/16S rRNA (cytidine1409-2'-O)-methyltransferase
VNNRKRLDAELVRRKLVASRSQAADLIQRQKVTVAGTIATNPARLVAPGEPIALLGPRPRFVGRGGEKLLAAIEHFGIDATGKHALDVGASTGGFTDCWLRQGAMSVVALDVGHGQLHERLRADERVVVMERTNIRHVTPVDVQLAPFPLISIDVSFISLKTIAGSVVALATPGADIVALIKPQFEAGRREVSKGKGVVKGGEVWREVLHDTLDSLRSHGAATIGVMVSPLAGADGNIEFLGWCKTASEAAMVSEEEIERVVAEAEVRSEGKNE